MPTQTVGDVELYYELHGAGQPVVLIHGLAGNCDAWKAQIEVLSKDYRVLALDNRGAGRSSAPDYPYTTRHFADDTIGLMDAVGITEPAHVVGRSMGGAIAQEITLAYPDRVRSLVITASFGKLDRYGYRILHNINEVVKAQGFAAAARHQSLFFFPPSYFNEHPEQFDAFEETLTEAAGSVGGYSNATHACLTHDSLDRLHQVKCPTLVMTGGKDVLCAADCSRAIAERIPNCGLRVYEQASHFFLVQCYEESMADLKNFIDQHAA